MSRSWLALLLAAVLGAVGNYLAWLLLDVSFGFEHKFGVLSHPIFILILGAIGGIVAGQKYLEHRAQKLADLDDPPEPESTTSDSSDHGNHREGDSFPELTAFSMADERLICHVGTERVNNVVVEFYSVTVIDHSSERSTHRTVRTITLMPADDLPAFYLRPRRLSDTFLSWFGSVGLTFDVNGVNGSENARLVRDFAHCFRLTAVSPEKMISGEIVEPPEAKIRKLFSLATMKQLVLRPYLSVESAGGKLAFWHGGELGRKRRRQLAADAVAVRSSFLATHGGQDKSPTVPAPASSVSAVRQAARLQASMLGGVFGAFAGFFTSAVINSGRFFSRPFGERSAAFEEDGGIFLMCIMSGAALGILIGVSLPLQRPLLQKPKDPRREKIVGCFILAGLFLGGVLGGISGIVAGEWLNLGFEDSGRRAQLFFAGVGIGTLVCPIVIGVTVNKLYKLISGRD